MAKPYPVRITVHYDDGTPVDKALVVMKPQDIAKVGGTWSHAARTNEQGIANMFSDGIYLGVPAGSYSVTVSKRLDAAVGPPPPPLGGTGKGPVLPDQYSYIGDEYADPDTTPITVAVEKKNNNIKIVVGPPVKILKRIKIR